MRAATLGSAPAGLSTSDYTKLYKYCGKAWPKTGKRDTAILEPRVDFKPADAQEVKPEGKLSGSVGKKLWSGDFGTCVGLVVTGTPSKAGGDAEFIAHVTIPDWSSIRTQFNAFAKDVESAELKDAKGWIYTVDTRSTAEEVKGDKYMEEQAEDLEKIYQPMYYQLGVLVNEANEKSASAFNPVTRKYHPWGKPGAITVSGKNAVTFSPQS